MKTKHQTNILWESPEYDSMENCRIITTKKGTEIHSLIIGGNRESLYWVTYSIRTNPNWETTGFEIKTLTRDTHNRIRFESDGKGNWTTEGKQAKQFNGCIDIDISLTPFTNTLPIRRLKLAKQETRRIKVLYLDLLNQQIKPVHQQYTRISQTMYRYENVPNDFEALIEVDEQGLILDYPGLFFRKNLKKQPTFEHHEVTVNFDRL